LRKPAIYAAPANPLFHAIVPRLIAFTAAALQSTVPTFSGHTSVTASGLHHIGMAIGRFKRQCNAMQPKWEYNCIAIKNI
jgi:hypothetical protein